MGSENPGVGKLLPWGALTPEGKGQLLAQTPGHQALPSEPPGKPKNTEVGSLSLFLGIEPGSPALQVASLPAELPEKPEEAHILPYLNLNLVLIF